MMYCRVGIAHHCDHGGQCPPYLLHGFKDQVSVRLSGDKYGLKRSAMIHSYGFAVASDRQTCATRLFVSSMRLIPSGLTRYFVADKILFLKSKFFTQFVAE